MTAILRPDDLSIGQFVTVLNAPHRAQSYLVGDQDVTQFIIDYSLDGEPLQILALNLPYVLAGLIRGNGRRIIDIRETDLMRVSLDYLSAFIPPAAKQGEQARAAGGMQVTCDCPACTGK